ncbi:MAG: hypothetical protein KKB70_04860 [Proteobacteria bacterium]|nr:hypothetical protein [Pseudomonadota bacterium]MBU1611075.1 hypothetical protein [Pseudomonadota bacterium]
MLWIHPLLQAICMVLATWVLFMGLQRFRAQHLGIKVLFPWKRHVFWGKVVHAIWLLGFGLGLFMGWYSWGSINLTGGHFLVGVSMVPMILLSLITGLMLQKPKGRRASLALFHGTVNAVLFAMALYQAFSAVAVIELFLLP